MFSSIKSLIGAFSALEAHAAATRRAPISFETETALLAEHKLHSDDDSDASMLFYHDLDGKKLRDWYRRPYVIIIAGISAICILAIAIVAILVKRNHTPLIRDIRRGPYLQYTLGPHWHGWSKTSHMIVTGDSWSATAFAPVSGPPSAARPISNQPWPLAPEYHEDFAWNWVTRMMATYNQSLVTVQNLAVGGSTITKPIELQGRAMADQVNKDFVALHDNRMDQAAIIYDWKADSTLLFAWFGVNDIGRIVGSKALSIFADQWPLYRQSLDKMYELGVRNFFLVDAPPYAVFPISTMVANKEDFQAASVAWRANMTNLVWDFAASNTDASVFLFSSLDLFTDVVANTCLFKETCGFSTTGFYCQDMMGKPGWNGSEAECVSSKDKFMWVDYIHPTPVMHNATAHAFSNALSAASPT